MTATVVETILATTPDVEAIAVLATITVEREHRGGYNRDLFAVWSDLDGNGCDTREDVLSAEEIGAQQAEQVGCELPAGTWYSVYDATTTASPSTFDIDHLVPLKEAWDSGAWDWSPERRIAFANDMTDQRTLLAVSAESNRSKGDKDPSNWLPEPGHVRQYLSDWVAIKARWSLSMDESEYGRIRNLLRRECRGTVVAPWPAPVG
ncbi:MAG TPA: HNH endonuclease family protein [Ilumatobacteraceae bacterium]|nr:HNH endonuclease family protein [Ilumatobacteraceae bacterium]HRB03490.1 HNH endonuclease family protein [Ilumatobacteraceae bacterium]